MSVPYDSMGISEPVDRAGSRSGERYYRPQGAPPCRCWSLTSQLEPQKNLVKIV